MHHSVGEVRELKRSGRVVHHLGGGRGRVVQESGGGVGRR